MDEIRKEQLTNLQGYILLIQKPGDPAFYGPIENSWSLNVEPNRTKFFWSSDTAADNLGNTGIKIDGRKNVEQELTYWKEKYPDWLYTIWNARDTEKLPIVINWDLWLDAHEPSDKTFSGIKNKHEARNLRFVIKGQPVDSTKTAPALTGQVSVATLRV